MLWDLVHVFVTLFSSSTTSQVFLSYTFTDSQKEDNGSLYVWNQFFLKSIGREEASFKTVTYMVGFENDFSSHFQATIHLRNLPQACIVVISKECKILKN